MIKLAVIGAGYWGTKLITEYLALSEKRHDIKLVAVADVSHEKLLQVGKSLSLPNSILKKDYEEIIETPEITGVHITTPNETHYEIATKAIAAGKHVLLEKPMSMSSSDAFRLARFAEKNNSVLLIGHIFRFNNAINKVKAIVEEKEINGIRCVELRWASFMPPPPGRDVIFDLAPHPIDILNHIFEEWPIQVYVKAHRYERKKVGLEEVAFATLTFPDDIIASVVLSWIHHGPRQRTVTIVSKKASIEVKAVEQAITMYESGQANKISIERNNTIESEINHFVERIKNNDPPINSALTGAMNVTVLEAMRKSLQRNVVTSIIGG
jgi:UDP-N-acetylglucosamine 3-dehydrogenase